MRTVEGKMPSRRPARTPTWCRWICSGGLSVRSLGGAVLRWVVDVESCAAELVGAFVPVEGEVGRLVEGEEGGLPGVSLGGEEVSRVGRLGLGHTTSRQ